MPRARRGRLGRHEASCPAIYCHHHHYMLWSGLASTTRSGGVLRECSYTGVSRQPLARAISRIVRGSLSTQGRRHHKPKGCGCRGKQVRLYRTAVGRENRKPFEISRTDPVRRGLARPYLIGSTWEVAARPEDIGVPVSRRIGQLSNLDWGWLTVLFALALGAAVFLISRVRSRRRPRIAAMPASFFTRRRASGAEGKATSQGPRTGPVVLPGGAPPEPPVGPVALADEHPLPPFAPIGPLRPPPPPLRDDLVVTIDLTELEKEYEPALDQELARLPADPWA